VVWEGGGWSGGGSWSGVGEVIDSGANLYLSLTGGLCLSASAVAQGYGEQALT